MTDDLSLSRKYGAICEHCHKQRALANPACEQHKRKRLVEEVLAKHSMTDEEAIQKAAAIINKAALDLLQVDPHDWSTRPCQTCRAISAIIGRRFGCYQYAHEKAQARTAIG